MSCYYPVGTYRTDGSNAYRPCGGCIGCKLDYSRQWAIRSVHEASLVDQSCMITLTYNDENLPKNRSVEKAELQKFVKRLRKKIYPKRISYYGCGEYGTKTQRPHYHICVFGFDFSDKELYNNRWVKRSRFNINERPNYSLFISKDLGKLWKKGFHTIGEVNLESAGYTARYVAKKITGSKAIEHYKGRIPEFSIMSTRPALGKTWIENYYNDVYPKDYFTIKGIRYRPPRYYDTCLEKISPKMYKEVKEKRKEYGEKRRIEDTIISYNREKSKRLSVKKLERKLH